MKSTFFFIACLSLLLPASTHGMFSHELSRETTGHLLSSVTKDTDTVYLNFPFFSVPVISSEATKTRVGIPEIFGSYSYEYKSNNPVLQLAITAWFAALIGTIIYQKYYAPETTENTETEVVA